MPLTARNGAQGCERHGRENPRASSPGGMRIKPCRLTLGVFAVGSVCYMACTEASLQLILGLVRW